MTSKIEIARYLADTRYGDDVEVDDGAECSPVDKGVWVQAWVFVDNDDITHAVNDPNALPPVLRC